MDSGGHGAAQLSEAERRRKAKNLRNKNRKKARKRRRRPPRSDRAQVSQPSGSKAADVTAPSQGLAAKKPRTDTFARAQPRVDPWEWWDSIGRPKFALAPMVGQSELAFRKLCRRYGASLGYTPMFIAGPFVRDPAYRRRVWTTCARDRPLVVQFCGSDKAELLAAARLVEDHCDAVDLNLGCPQKVAKRGGYGAFLMDDWPRLASIVSHLTSHVSVPVLCKVRVFAEVEKTVSYCKMLQSAGASLLAVHPRQRHQREEVLADWSQVKAIRNGGVTVPLLANGDVYHVEDALLCLKETGADGVMSAQGLLHNPALFEPLVKLDESSWPKAPDRTLSHMRRPRNISAFAAFSLSFAYGRRQSGKGGRGMTVPGNRDRVTKRIKDADRALKAKLNALGHSKDNHDKKTRNNTENAGQGAPTRHGGFTTSDVTGGLSSAVSTPADVRRRFELAREYLAICETHPPCHPSVVRRHLFFILFFQFHANLDLFDRLAVISGDAQYSALVNALERRAELGRPHPDAKGEKDKKRPRYRDGSLAPPPWPIGGGGFHVTGGAPGDWAREKGKKAAAAVAAASAVATPKGRSPVSVLASALCKFYAKHNPSRIANVDKIVSLYGGRPNELSSMLRGRYGEGLDL